jgi:hypothetical protein
MKVPKLRADIGGDIGPGDLGFGVVEMMVCEGKPFPENRWGRSDDVTRGALGSPWVESGLLFTAEAPGTARVLMVVCWLRPSRDGACQERIGRVCRVCSTVGRYETTCRAEIITKVSMRKRVAVRRKLCRQGNNVSERGATRQEYGNDKLRPQNQSIR